MLSGYGNINITMSEHGVTNIFKKLNDLPWRYRPHGGNAYFKAFSGHVIQLLS